MKKYFDTHAHITKEFYENSIDDVINDAINCGVTKMVIPGTTEADTYESISISRIFPNNVYAAAGIHPSEATSYDVANYLDDLDPHDIIAIGEVGIDLYYKSNPPLEVQEFIFRKHIEFAIKHNKPILIHERNSSKEIFRILNDYKGRLPKFIVHCFHSTYEEGMKYIELGGYLSIPGIATFKKLNEFREVISKLPLDKLLIETDSPFLTPEPFRGKKNFPKYVKYIGNLIADLREEENVHEILFNNALNIFNL